ncbi:MAG: hypothetical protein LBR70_02145 [Lactobacillaceae bacterium]|jgi:hypothetical protein|nr:hypothetical protein [Lactobacillaceae bacterium]
MIINGHRIALTEQDLNKMLGEETQVFNLISPEFEGYKKLKKGDKDALVFLVKAAKIINDVSLKQDHPLNMELKKALEEAAKNNNIAAKALELFNSLNGVEGSNGIDKEPVKIFEDVNGYIGRNFYPIDLSVEEFHEILAEMFNENKIAEIRKILSARTMVRRDGNGIKAIDYTEYFKDEFAKIALALDKASNLVTNDNFAEYLDLQAKALLKNDEKLDMLADMKWAELQYTDLEFTLSRENYDDGMTPTVLENKSLKKLIEEHNIEVVSKDMLGIRVGIVNKKGTELILRFKDYMKELAKLMPLSDKYEQLVAQNGDVKQAMVDADLIELKGDYAQCRGGITTAQNLPNNDKLSVKKGGGRRNVYHRQIRMASDAEKRKKILENLVSAELHKYYNDEADHLFVIGHENGHSLGPDSSYQNALGKYKHIIEEHKADVISIAMMPEYVNSRVIDEKTLKEVYVTWVVKRLFLVAEAKFDHPHRMADSIQFNYLFENKVISFDKEAKLIVNFDVFDKVMKRLLHDTIEVQISKSPEKAKEFIDKYVIWGKESVRISKFLKSLGLKPYKKIRTYF